MFSATRVASIFRLAHFNDVQADLGTGHLGHVTAQLLDVGALLANHDTRTGRMDRDPRLLGRTLDDDAADTGTGKTLLEHLAKFEVFQQQVTIGLAIGEPAESQVR